MATYLTAIDVDMDVEGRTYETSIDLSGDGIDYDEVDFAPGQLAKTVFTAPDDFITFIGGMSSFQWICVPLNTVCRNYKPSKARWDPVINSPLEQTKGYAVRSIRECNIGDHKFPTIIQCKELKTTKAGLRQDMHMDVHEHIAHGLELFVFLGNISNERCCILIGDTSIWLNPGRGIVFPAYLIHAGSGFKHASRLYVLFSSRRLNSDEIAEAKESSETLGFYNKYPPHYAGRY